MAAVIQGADTTTETCVGRKRRLLVVAGPGRSGTSLYTGLVARLGYHVPKPEVASNSSNPRGFSEPRWAVDFHNQLLDRARVHVDDGRPEAWDRTARIGAAERPRLRLRGWLEEQFAEHDHVVVKDPRLAWFLDLYRAVAADLGVEVSVATLIRHPTEVLRSREIAYGRKTPNSARAMAWINMMLGIESRTRDLPRAVVAYDDLLDGWREAIEVADRGLGLGLVSSATQAQLASAGTLVDPSLRRSSASWEELDLPPRIRDLLERVHTAYGTLVTGPVDEHPGCRDRLDELSSEFAQFYTESWQAVAHRVRARLAAERRRGAEEAALAASPRPATTRAASIRAFAGRWRSRVSGRRRS